MPEAVIVATARSPIGRAFKGSLTPIRPAMGQTAKNVAQLMGVTRAEQDEFGVRSRSVAAERLS